VIRTFKYNNTLGLCILLAHLPIQITNIGTMHRLQRSDLDEIGNRGGGICLYLY
jgi:hypothetical protein